MCDESKLICSIMFQSDECDSPKLIWYNISENKNVKYLQKWWSRVYNFCFIAAFNNVVRIYLVDMLWKNNSRYDAAPREFLKSDVWVTKRHSI